MSDRNIHATEEQLAYAQILNIGMKAGLAILVVTFAIYVFGVLQPNVPVDQVSNYWELSAEEYVTETGGHHGWGWVGSLDQSDFLNFVGIAFLAAVTIICYARVLPILVKQKDLVYAIFVLAEITVLALAASGWLKSGGH
jgi:hypothetical protein